jgi:hypothetical protein
MVNLHNQARAAVSPPAASMPQISWDSETEDFAIAYAQKCLGGGLMNHNPTRYLPNGDYLGENIWATTGKFSVNDNSLTDAVSGSVSSWVDEKPDYDYASNQCINGAMCGHYTQVVWANTAKVGCAVVSCPNLTFGSTILCNYRIGGNWVGSKPYVSA